MVNRIAGVLEDMENARNGGEDRRMPASRFAVDGTAEEQLEAAMQALERGARLGLVGSGTEDAKALVRHLFAVKPPDPLAEGSFELRITLFGVEFKADGQLDPQEAGNPTHLRKGLEKLVGIMLSAIGEFARKVAGPLEAERRRNLLEGGGNGSEEEGRHEEHDPAEEQREEELGHEEHDGEQDGPEARDAGTDGRGS